MPVIEWVLWILAGWVAVSFGLTLAWIIFSSIVQWFWRIFGNPISNERRMRRRQVDRLIAQYKREHEGRRR